MILGGSALGQLALAELPQRVTVSTGPSSVADSLTFSDVFRAIQISTVNVTETLLFVDAFNFISTGPVTVTGSITETLLLADAFDATSGQVTADTHDGGFVKKKKKKKKPDDFAEEVARRDKLRKQIVEVIHPPVIEEPEPKHEPEVVEAKGFEIKTDIAPPVDYAGLAREEIVEKLRKDAELKARQEFERQKEFERQAELKRLADIEDEDELEMILEALL